jgi:pimeloyl-ACP methyl ester carboxylesterase
MVLVGGGCISDLGVTVKPLAEHDDYAGFVGKTSRIGWRIFALRGKNADLVSYYVVISDLARKINAEQKQKPILVGHSAGAIVCLDYLKDRSQEARGFEKIILFNCPLVYPQVDAPALASCYQGANRVLANTVLVMSTNDNVLDEWTVKGVSISQAIDIVRQTGKTTGRIVVDVVNRPDYDHSPFSPNSVAWDNISKIPVGVTLHAVTASKIRALNILFGRIASKLRNWVMRLLGRGT